MRCTEPQFNHISVNVTAERDMLMFLTPLFFQCQAAILTDLSHKAKVDKKVTKKRWNAAKIGLVARQAKISKTKAEFLAQLEDQKE